MFENSQPADRAGRARGLVAKSLACAGLLLLIALPSAAAGPKFPGDVVSRGGAPGDTSLTWRPNADELEACGLAPNEEGAPAPGRASVDRIELELFHLANRDRLRNGLLPLQLDCELLDIASARAADQLLAGRLAHTDERGDLAVVRLIEESQLSYRLVGENLAQVGGPPEGAAALAEQAFMNSPAHRANILDPAFELLAIGAATDANRQIVFAQIFRAEGRR